MIAEDVLERGLAAAAEDYEVPAGAVDRLRAELAPQVAAERPAGGNPRGPRVVRRGWYAVAAGAAAGLIALPLAIGGSGGDQAGSALRVNGPATRVPVAGDADAPAIRDHGLTYAPYAPTGTSPGKRPVDPAATPTRVVKTGVLDLRVPRGQVSATLDKVADIAVALRGYVESSRTSEGSVAPSGRVTLRVPVTEFEAAVARARALGKVPGARVLGLQTSGEDVTGKYVDLQARIHVLQQTRDTFLDLLAKAQTIGETLSVQQRVTDVQTQIEQLQGQLKVLGSQSDLSTLTVTVDQRPVVTTPPGEKSGIHKAFDRSVDRFVNGVEAIVAGIGPVLLALLVIAALWFGGRFGYRALRRTMV